MKRINVLYTGGLDSSYTMMYFSRFPVRIQPYYLRDNRPSEEYELNAIREIIADIRKNPGTKAVVNDPILEYTYNIKPDLQIQKAYHHMYKEAGLGSQYGFIARYAKQIGIHDFFVSLVYTEEGRGNMAVRNSGGVMQMKSSMGMEAYRLDPRKTEKNLYTLFKDILLPPSFMRTKDQEIEEMKSMGFEDSIKKTWFCFWPVDGKPCGTCDPCKDLIKAGMLWRFPKEALERYEKDKNAPKWKHKLRGIKLTLSQFYYKIRMSAAQKFSCKEDKNEAGEV